MKSNLLKNQSSARSHLQGWKVGALFMEAGTGKTRVAHELISMTDADLCVWLAPLRTLDNARQELAKWGELPMSIHFVGVESISQSDRIYFQTMEIMERAKKPFMVVDESLKIKNAETKRTQRAILLGLEAEYKLILNGTPLSKSLMDLYPQMQFLSPKILNMTIGQFKDTFCNYTKLIKRIGRKEIVKEWITGYENIDYLYSLISPYVYECDLHLNITQNWHVIGYEISQEERELYNEIKAYFLSVEGLEEWNNNIFMAMTQKMQHAYCCSSSKVEAVRKLFNSGVQEKKTIIFCKFIDSRELCEQSFSKAKILSYQKEAFGLNLQNYSNTIFFDKTFDWAQKVQGSRRTYRTGQEYNCHYWDLTGNVGLEKMIDRNIEKKVSMSEYFKSKTKEEISTEL